MSEAMKKNLSTDVAERICAMIHQERRFAPGDRLPTERDFAEELGVSRTSIREAFKLLHANGTLDLRRGVGAFVRETPGLPPDPLGLSQIADQHRLLLSWYEVRLMLEPPALYGVVERAAPEDIDRLQALEEQIALAVCAGERVWQLDMQFHSTLAKYTENEILYRIFAGIGQSFQALLPENPTAPPVFRPHEEIIKFLHLRDAEGAALAMRYHLMQEIRRLKQEE